MAIMKTTAPRRQIIPAWVDKEAAPTGAVPGNPRLGVINRDDRSLNTE